MNNEANTNINLIDMDLGVSSGVFPTREDADTWAENAGMRTFRLSPTARPCWTRY